MASGCRWRRPSGLTSWSSERLLLVLPQLLRSTLMPFAAWLWASFFSHSTIDLLKLSFFHSIDLLKFFFNHSINGSRRNYVEMIRIMKGTLFIICSSFDVSEAPVRCSDNIQSAIKSLSGNQIVHSSYMYTVTQ